MKAAKREGSVLSASPQRHSSADSACQCRKPLSDESDMNSTNDSCSSPNSSICGGINTVTPHHVTAAAPFELQKDLGDALVR